MEVDPVTFVIRLIEFLALVGFVIMICSVFGRYGGNATRAGKSIARGVREQRNYTDDRYDPGGFLAQEQIQEERQTRLIQEQEARARGDEKMMRELAEERRRCPGGLCVPYRGTWITQEGFDRMTANDTPAQQPVKAPKPKRQREQIQQPVMSGRDWRERVNEIAQENGTAPVFGDASDRSTGLPDGWEWQ